MSETYIKSNVLTLSFGRCLMKGNLLFDKFYDYFLKSNPQIPLMFAKTDMAKQKSLLRTGINMAIMYGTATGKSLATHSLDRLKGTHSKKNLNVRPELYSFWIKSFLKALEETDPEFNPQLKAEWEKVLKNACDYLISGYHT